MKPFIYYHLLSEILTAIVHCFAPQLQRYHFITPSHSPTITLSHYHSLTLSIASGISCPALSASLSYYDSYRRKQSPANLTQAQRDYFGAHTYARTDREGIYHTLWTATHNNNDKK